MTKEKAKKEKKVYTFDEKTEEWHSKLGKKLSVWQSPKYIQSKTKAVELIEGDKYGLDEGDFWILKNLIGSGDKAKMMYTGLIISHNGCLKINDKTDNKMKFKPSCVEFVKDEADKVKVMKYVNDEQGVYEFGEISPKNCMNDYPYAMVLKRLMDRVILKNSKVGFFGIYSDSESEDFKEKPESEDSKPSLANVVEGVGDDMKVLVEQEKKVKTARKTKAEEYFMRLKKDIENSGSPEEIDALLEKENSAIEKLKGGYKTIYNQLMSCVKEMKTIMNGESDE